VFASQESGQARASQALWLEIGRAACEEWGMLDWNQCSAVERDPQKVSGAWVFRGTRLPVRALFENLEGGATIEEFIEWFPGVSKEQVLAVLAFAEESLAVR
jgi:uncharacterized protein (DUF433 family)